MHYWWDITYAPEIMESFKNCVWSKKWKSSFFYLKLMLLNHLVYSHFFSRFHVAITEISPVLFNIFYTKVIYNKLMNKYFGGIFYRSSLKYLAHLNDKENHLQFNIGLWFINTTHTHLNSMYKKLQDILKSLIKRTHNIKNSVIKLFLFK